MVVLEIAAYAIVVIAACAACVLGAVYQGWVLALLGLVAGFMAGILIDLIFIPPIAVLFSINDNLSKIRDYMKSDRDKRSLGGSSDKQKRDKVQGTDDTSKEDSHKEALARQKESLSKLYNNNER